MWKFTIIACLFLHQLFALDKKDSFSPSFFNEHFNKRENKEWGQEIIFLDARSFKEYQISHLFDATRVDEKNENILDYIKKSDLEKKMIVVYCTLGFRSLTVVNEWREKGHTNVFNLSGGIIAWIKEGLPVYSNGTPTKYVHSYSYIISWLIPKGYNGVWK